MSELVTGDFDYGSVDEQTAQKLEYFVKSGKALYRKHQIQFIADMGKLLSEARDLLANNKSGTFIKWATSEFDIEKATVYRWVNAWDRILSHGETIYLHWSPTALYLASAEDFPKPVMKKLEKIPATELVRTSDVKRLIAASKPKAEPIYRDDSRAATTEDSPPETEPDDLPEDYTETDDTAAGDAPEPEKPQASIMLDSLGKQIPKNLRSASELAIQLNATGRELDRFRQSAKEFAEQPGGEWLRVQDISAGLKTLKDHFQQAAYHTVCQKCSGKGCKTCEQTGWMPAYLKGTL